LSAVRTNRISTENRTHLLELIGLPDALIRVAFGN